MKHTNEPWKYYESLEAICIRRDHELKMVADFAKAMLGNREEERANAHLIAAAPDLLEACKYVVRYHRENDSGEGELFGLDFVITCINVIRKAEGV